MNSNHKDKPKDKDKKDKKEKEKKGGFLGLGRKKKDKKGDKSAEEPKGTNKTNGDTNKTNGDTPKNTGDKNSDNKSQSSDKKASDRDGQSNRSEDSKNHSREASTGTKTNASEASKSEKGILLLCTKFQNFGSNVFKATLLCIKSPICRQRRFIGCFGRVQKAGSQRHCQVHGHDHCFEH